MVSTLDTPNKPAAPVANKPPVKSSRPQPEPPAPPKPMPASPTPSPITPLSFEQPLVAIQQQIDALQAQYTATATNNPEFEEHIALLRQQADDVRTKLYGSLSPGQRLQIARHPQRLNFLELVKFLSPTTWFELHGDRAGMDDRAMIGGIIELDGRPMMMVGTQKGRGMKENLVHNFGMANPEGYRKAMRLFSHAEKFHMPILTIIDTPGAYPGIAGEEKGIGQAIAWNIREMARLKTPVISLVLGEASSGGALGIGVANRILMLEHALYTVISPEGCASILWRSAEYATQAAEALKITAPDLLGFGMIDEVIPEPLGGAHQDNALTAQRIHDSVLRHLNQLSALDAPTLVADRYSKYRAMSAFTG